MMLLLIVTELKEPGLLSPDALSRAVGNPEPFSLKDL